MFISLLATSPITVSVERDPERFSGQSVLNLAASPITSSANESDNARQRLRGQPDAPLFLMQDASEELGIRAGQTRQLFRAQTVTLAQDGGEGVSGLHAQTVG